MLTHEASRSVAFSRRQRFVATSSFDGTVYSNATTGFPHHFRENLLPAVQARQLRHSLGPFIACFPAPHSNIVSMRGVLLLHFTVVPIAYVSIGC